MATGKTNAGGVADLAVTTEKIASKAVTTGKIADKAVTTAQLGDASVGTAQLDALAVSAAKLAASAVETAKIKDKAVTTAKIADHAVSVDYTTTLNTTWSGSAAPYTKEQTVNGILAADKPVIDLVPSAAFADAAKQENAWALVYRAVTAENKITFYAKAKPTVSIPLQIRCIRK